MYVLVGMCEYVFNDVVRTINSLFCKQQKVSCIVSESSMPSARMGTSWTPDEPTSSLAIATGATTLISPSHLVTNDFNNGDTQTVSTTTLRLGPRDFIEVLPESVLWETISNTSGSNTTKWLFVYYPLLTVVAAVDVLYSHLSCWAHSVPDQHAVCLLACSVCILTQFNLSTQLYSSLRTIHWSQYHSVPHIWNVKSHISVPPTISTSTKLQNGGHTPPLPVPHLDVDIGTLQYRRIEAGLTPVCLCFSHPGVICQLSSYVCTLHSSACQEWFWNLVSIPIEILHYSVFVFRILKTILRLLPQIEPFNSHCAGYRLFCTLPSSVVSKGKGFYVQSLGIMSIVCGSNASIMVLDVEGCLARSVSCDNPEVKGVGRQPQHISESDQAKPLNSSWSVHPFLLKPQYVLESYPLSTLGYFFFEPKVLCVGSAPHGTVTPT